MEKLVSEDAARRALLRMDEASGTAWLDRHLAKTTQPLLAMPWILDLDATVAALAHYPCASRHLHLPVQ